MRVARTIVWAVVLVFALGMVDAISAATLTKEELKTAYMKLLQEEGYSPIAEDNGQVVDVVFKHEGGIYFIRLYPNDQEFFQLVYPNYWKIKSEAEMKKALAAADYSNATSKVAKTQIISSNIWSTVELLIISPDQVKPILKRALSTLQQGVYNFTQKMRE